MYKMKTTKETVAFLRQKLVRYKAYAGRVLSYAIFGTYLMQIYDKSPNLWWFSGLSIFSIGLLLFIGSIDYNHGFLEDETKHTGKKNYWMMKLVAGQEEIKERLDQLEKRNE